MSFSLRNAAQTFQQFIDEVLRDVDFCYAYIDDVLVASTSENEHRQHLRTLFQRFSKYGVLLNPAKCVFGAEEVTFLGYTVSARGTWPLEEKVAAINHFKQPALVKDLRRFLGMLKFYRRFVTQATSIQAPLPAALAGLNVKGSQPVDWTPTMVQAFEGCKASLSRATLLAHPDPSATLALFTDASDNSIGAALQQRVCDAWQTLAFYSHKLSPSQQKYSPYNRELLAVYEAIKYFRHMVEGCPFVIFTDHKLLTHAFQQQRGKCSPCQFRHLEFIGQFSTDFRHVSGQDNVVADALSRANSIMSPLDYPALAHSQDQDAVLQHGSVLRLERVHIPGTDVSLYCDTSTSQPRPFITTPFRCLVFDTLHDLSHPGANATVKLVSPQFV
jgi:cleavage and polyadenylation specificity factor subunit 1